jgi:hypothetical protein
MYAGKKYKAEMRVVELVSEKQRAIVRTRVLNSKNEITIDGEALIQNNKI